MNLILKLSVLLTATMVLVSCKGKSSSGPYDDDLYPDDGLSSEAYSSSSEASGSSSSGVSSSSSQGAQSSSSLELFSSSSYERSSSSRVVAVQDFDTTFTDPRDGKIYRTVVVNGDLWFGQNLNYASGGYCYQDYEPNCEKYGRLYTYAEAKTVCPSGWHLPSQNEYDGAVAFLKQRLGAPEYPSDWTENYLGATFGWTYDMPSKDLYGFALLPAGYRDPNGNYYDAGIAAHMITSNESDLNGGYPFRRAYQTYKTDDSVVHFSIIDFVNAAGNYDNAYSVRCIKDNSVALPAGVDEVRAGPRVVEDWTEPPAIQKYTGPFGEYVDERDGHVYNTVETDSQVWMTSNINYATENSGCYEGSSAYCDFLGRLYKQSDIYDACPAGWRIPSTKDWGKLKAYAIATNGGIESVEPLLKSTTRWGADRSFAYDALGLTIYPAGVKKERAGDYVSYGYIAIYYTVDSGASDTTHILSVTTLDKTFKIGASMSYYTDYWLSIRCMKDKE